MAVVCAASQVAIQPGVGFVFRLMTGHVRSLLDAALASAGVRTYVWEPPEQGAATVHPDDRDAFREALQRSNSEFRHEYRLTTGEYVKNHGFFSGNALAGVTVDVSERKRIADRFELAARASQAMVYDWDMITNETFRSDAVREVTGYSPDETRRSDWWIADIHPDDVERARTRFAQAVESGTDRYESEYRVRHREGSWRYLWDRGFIVRDASGRAIRAIGSTIDVTARRLAEEAQRQARAEAERANKAKDDFLTTLSHELRTPMTSILGWTSMLSYGMVSEEMMPLALSSIQESAQTQANLIEDLLDISRVATGKLRIEMQPVNLVSVIASAVESFRLNAATRHIDLHLSIDAPDILILGDEERVRQVITNLLSNSFKFTPHGGRIEVVLSARENIATVVVSDSGIGIASDFLPHVFDRFSQQQQDQTRTHAGLGIGLAIVRQLVELHGGAVKAESDGDGKGATFTVTFPRAGVSARAHSDVSIRRAPRLDGVHVLLVEDEPKARGFMQAVLTASGAAVRAAASVAEALDGNDEPAIVVSDIAMPDEDGLSLIAKLRVRDASAGRRTPALAVTALGFDEDRRRILSAGFDQYLSKPFDPLVLLETVAQMVGRT